MVNISRIDLNLFVVFDAIYTEGGITRASETLNLSQPAISHSLGRLRELIGDPLFIRQGNAMLPTPHAHELIEPVRRALGDIERSLKQLARFDPATSQREFKIGMRPLVEAAAIPELMIEIGDSAPDVKIAAVHHGRSDFQSHLVSNTLSAVVDVQLPAAHNVHQKFLGGGKMVVVARNGHPALHGPLTMETYLRQTHVIASTRPAGPSPEDQELARLGLQRKIKLRCQHYGTACKVVSTSDLLLTMPERFARGTNSPLDNQILPFPIDLPAPDIFLYWHASADNDPANLWLRERICATFQRC